MTPKLTVPVALLAAFVSAAPAAVAGPAEDLAEALEADDRGDLTTAVNRMRTLAETGYARAQAAFGMLYFNGRGVPQDFVEAHKWFSLAASRLQPGGERDAAANNRDLAAQRLTPAQIAHAEELARAWTPK